MVQTAATPVGFTVWTLSAQAWYWPILSTHGTQYCSMHAVQQQPCPDNECMVEMANVEWR